MRKVYFILSLFLLVLSFNSCDYFLEEDPYVKFDAASFANAKSKWESLGVSNYSFTYSIHSDATGPNSVQYNVTVTDQVSSCTITNPDADSEDGEDTSDYENRFLTVDSIFDFIWNIYEEDLENAKEKRKGIYCYDISVSYDESTGIPTLIETSTESDGSWAGDGFSMTVWNISLNP